MSEDRAPSGRFDSPGDAARGAQRDVPDYGADTGVEAAGEFDRHGDSTADAASGAVFPWPPREGGSVAGAFVQTWQDATLQPAAFYRGLSERAPIGSALLYYLPLGILVAGGELFWGLVRSPATEQDSTLSTIAASDAAWYPLAVFLFSPLLLLVSLFLSAAVAHLLLKVFGGASRDYTTTARVFAFAYSPMIFSVVPVLGTIIGFAWMVVVGIIGLRVAHNTSTGRAAAAVLIPVMFAAVMLLLAYVLRAAGTLLDMPL